MELRTLLHALYFLERNRFKEERVVGLKFILVICISLYIVEKNNIKVGVFPVYCLSLFYTLFYCVRMLAGYCGNNAIIGS